MKLESFKASVAAKTAAVANPATDDRTAESCLSDAVGDAAALFRRPVPGPAAIDPSFWLTIIQTLVPLILEWINRRFPRPAAPAPVPVSDPVTPA